MSEPDGSPNHGPHGEGSTSGEGGGDTEPLHRRLDAELADRLAEAALRCEDGEVRDLDRAQLVRVSGFDLQTAARCQAKAAAPPPEFEPSIFTTSRAVALRSVRWLRRSGSVVGAVSDAMRQIRRADRHPDDGSGTDLDWLGLYLSDESAAPVDVRVRIAARAVTWLATTLDVLGVDDLAATRRWRHDIRPRWRYPGRGLTLDGRVDLAIPVSGNFTPVFVVNNLHPATLDETAFNVCLWTINQRRPPLDVVVVDLPTATRRTIDPEELFERGVTAAVRTAEAVTARSEVPVNGPSTAAGEPLARGPAAMSRNPSPLVCQDCFWAPNCSAKADFDTKPIRKGGVQLTTANRVATRQRPPM
ncbi:MAG: hypothetical protein OER95_05750 [Acidimicrobiia bacterium]|nr:hypothetical protein [Acidimicrobiia bacterium]